MQNNKTIGNFSKKVVVNDKKGLENILLRKFFHPHCFPDNRKDSSETDTEVKSMGMVQDMFARVVAEKKAKRGKETIKEKKLKIVSSGYGLIKHIFFTYPKVQLDNCDKDPFRPIFEDLMIALAEILSDLTITVLAYDAAYVDSITKAIEKKHGDLFTTVTINYKIKKIEEADLKKILGNWKKELIHYGEIMEFVPEEINLPETDIFLANLESDFSIWAQDPFVILNSPDPNGKIYLLEPSSYLKSPIDAFIAEALEEHYIEDFEVLSPVSEQFKFHGGNILAGEDFLLAGVSAGEGREKKYAKELAKSFNIDEDRIHLIGIKPHDRQHTSRQKRIEKLTEDEFYKKNIKHNKAWKTTVQPLFHIDLFITLAGKSTDGQERLVIPYITSFYPEAQPTVELLNIYLQDVVEQLEECGNYHIHRNPIPLIPMDFKNAEEEERAWYFGLYNNALVQIGRGAEDNIPADKIGCIWMPTYGHCYGEDLDWSHLKMFDDANAALWERLGFMVKRLTDYNAFSLKKGGPHCILKCLKRVKGKN